MAAQAQGAGVGVGEGEGGGWFFEAAAGAPSAEPVSAAELGRLVAAGTVVSSTKVWTGGMPSWTPIAEMRAELTLAVELGLGRIVALTTVHRLNQIY